MINFIRRKTMITTALAGIIGAVTLILSGCLVSEDKDLKTLINRNNNDTLHTLQSGDFMEYSLSGQLTIGNDTQFVEGTLTTTWENASIPSPLGNTTQISVLKEITTLTLGNSTTYEALRYIKQQADGTLDVHAFDGRNLNEYYRVGPPGEALNDVDKISILYSDIKNTGSDDINYKIAEECETGPSCARKVHDVLEHVEYQGDVIVQTDVGRFNTLRLDYNGSFNATTSIATLFDIRGACEYSKATFNGSYYVFPQVGIVQITQNCNDGSAGGHNFTAVLTNTNITIPKPN